MNINESYGKRTIRIVNLEVFSQPHAWSPPTDLLETEKDYKIRIEIAGVNPDEVTISIVDNIITVVGRRLLGFKKCAYHRMEIARGEFQSIINLPEKIDSSESSAIYESGILLISLPKHEPRKIKITTDEGEK